MDGLRGLPDAIRAVFPNVCIQNCIIHQIINSIKYVSYKNKKEFMKDLKLVYKADTEEIALAQLDELKKKSTSPLPNWSVTLLKFEIMFKERINEALAI
jgi:putative transposase